MAHENGRLTTCDRCGITVFSKVVGEGERDGGFTRWNNFEPLPDGWKGHLETGTLCPCCNRQYEDFVTEFMKKE